MNKTSYLPVIYYILIIGGVLAVIGLVINYVRISREVYSSQIDPDPRVVYIKPPELSIQSDAELFATNCSAPDSDLTITNLEQQVFNEINTYRQSLGLVQLTDSLILRTAATWKSNDMSTNNYFAHDDSLGRIFANRIRDCGFSGGSGEILQKSPSTNAVQLVTNWKNSSGHDAIMRNGNFRAMGVSQNGNYWTVVFGTNGGGTTNPNPTNTPTPRPSNSPTQNQNPTTTPIPTNSPVPTVSPILNPTITVIPTVTLGVTPPVSGSPGSVNVEVQINGFQTQSGYTAQLPVKVTVLNADNQTVLTQTVTLASQQFAGRFKGSFTLPSNFAAGNYQVKIKADNTLQQQIQPVFVQINPGSSTSLPVVNLTAGDIDNDNRISLLDFNKMVTCMPKNTCRGAEYDLNYDGAIDIRDYNMLLYAFKTISGD